MPKLHQQRRLRNVVGKLRMKTKMRRRKLLLNRPRSQRRLRRSKTKMRRRKLLLNQPRSQRKLRK